MKKTISIIVAMTKKNVIGDRDEIPWKLKSDMRRFAQITRGHTVIMGRKTFNSIVRKLRKPLPDRTSIILSRNPIKKISNCLHASSLEEAFVLAEKADSLEEVFVIGGEEVYKATLPYANKMYITWVDSRCSGDTYFPDFDRKKWEMLSNESLKKSSDDDHNSLFCIYERRKTSRHLNLAHHRSDKQKTLMERILKDGVCPFCQKHFKKYHPKPILKTTTHWVVTENMEPYEGTRVHLLFIYKKEHATTLAEISESAAEELLKLTSWATKRFRIEGGALFMRFGDSDRTGASVSHLHAQLISGETTRSESKGTLMVKLGYKKFK